MPVAAPALDRPVTAIYQDFGQGDESMTSPYDAVLSNALAEMYRSNFWTCKKKFALARRQLAAASTLQQGWNTYDSEPPNHVAQELASQILALLENEATPPNRVRPSAEGGITISFVEGPNRADIETYNSGEIAAATYSDLTEAPRVWELNGDNTNIRDAIANIRVHLTT
jgi:hypothetical protein